MTSRRIRKSSRYCETHAAELLQGLLVAEMIAPSQTLWLVSGWVSDVPVIDNSVGAFSGLATRLPVRQIRLVEALVAVAEAGAQVVVVANEEDHNLAFAQRLEGFRANLSLEARSRITFRQKSNLHAKGFLGDDFYLTGSMNFTFNGIHVLEEEVTLHTDAQIVSRAKVDFTELFPLETL